MEEILVTGKEFGRIYDAEDPRHSPSWRSTDQIPTKKTPLLASLIPKGD